MSEKNQEDQRNVNYHRGSTVEFWKSKGIPSVNNTHKKMGQTTIMFSSQTSPALDDDSLAASIRNLKYIRIK
jgi:hypothetical protein